MVDGVSFGEAWRARATVSVQTAEEQLPLFYLGLSDLIRNKETCARPKDEEDPRFLRKLKR